MISRRITLIVRQFYIKYLRLSRSPRQRALDAILLRDRTVGLSSVPAHKGCPWQPSSSGNSRRSEPCICSKPDLLLPLITVLT